MYHSCQQKQEAIKALFIDCKDEEAKYEKIIELGKSQKHLDPSKRISENLVQGCQSQVFLHAFMQDGTVIFEVDSDALISAGLATLLVRAYSGETPEAILKCPPTFIEELGISSILTPNRANGLYSIHLRMKQIALAFLMKPTR